MNPMVSGLEFLGVEDRAISVYEFLLGRGAADVEQVRCFGGLTHLEAERLLDQLKAKGLIRQDSSVSDTFWAVNPELGLSPLLSRQEEQIKQQEMELIRSRARATKIIAEYNERRSEKFSDRLERVIGMESVRARIDELASSAESEMLSFIPHPVSEKAVERAMPLNKDMVARGISMRMIFLIGSLNDSFTLSYAREMSELGVQVRITPILPFRMLLYDRRISMLPMDPEKGSEGVVLLHERSVVMVLTTLFENHWEAARDLSEKQKRDDNGLSDLESAILRELALGLTDESVSRKLRISVRTLRRIVASLMSRMDANSRFQAGVQASRAGWL